MALLQTLTRTSLLGCWQSDDEATIAAEAQRLDVSRRQLREEFEVAGFLGVEMRFEEDTFVVESDAARQTASYKADTAIPCGTNQAWLQYTWDEMIAQPYQYVLATQHEPDVIELEWPNDRRILYRRAD